MNTQKSHHIHGAPNTNGIDLRKLSCRLSASLALGVALVLCGCGKKEELASSVPATASAQGMTDEEKNMSTALTIIDNYLGRERVEIPEHAPQQSIFINNIIQVLGAYEGDELIEQVRKIYNNQKENNRPALFPFDPNRCNNAEDFARESKEYLSTLSVYLTSWGLSQGIYEYDISDKNLQFVGKPIRKIVISHEETPFEGRVMTDDGVILLNLQALATNVYINRQIGLPPEAMIGGVIANELGNCEFYTDYDTSQVSEDDAFRLSEAYSTLKTLKSYKTSATLGGMLILTECINSHYSAIIGLDAWAGVDYNITHDCVLRAHKKILPHYAQEYPEIATIFETNDHAIKEKIKGVQGKLAKNPGRYENLGKKILEQYEQAFSDLCREKGARIKE